MSSSFSDKPSPIRREPEAGEALYSHEPPRLRHEQRVRLNYRRLLAGLSLLFIVTGLLLLCFIHGGLVNQRFDFMSGRRFIALDHAGHIIGFICLGIGAVGFVFLFSLEKRG